jgi:hypothetical protein
MSRFRRGNCLPRFSKKGRPWASKRISSFLLKSKPFTHILALCSILWQIKEMKVTVVWQQIRENDSLPGYGSQNRNAAILVLHMRDNLLAINGLVSVVYCQDMDHSGCQNMDKITDSLHLFLLTRVSFYSQLCNSPALAILQA